MEHIFEHLFSGQKEADATICVKLRAHLKHSSCVKLHNEITAIRRVLATVNQHGTRLLPFLDKQSRIDQRGRAVNGYDDFIICFLVNIRLFRYNLCFA